ncbi:MAG: MalY/PatB family protein [Lachnospirales bacterium]
MENFNFDEIVDRKNTNCLKFDFSEERGMPKDILPYWVADMDFRVPEVVISKIQECVSHGIFGYSDVKDDYSEVVINWFKKYFNYEFKKEWLIKTPSIVYALCASVNAFTKENDAILIQNPVYYPFTNSILNNNRILVNNSLVYKNGKYEVDFKDFEDKIVKNNVKMFILCNPHNPVGKVFTKAELTEIGEICLKHKVIIVVDEIHCDFTRNNNNHTIFLSIDEKFNEAAIVLTAPSKTFNIAGLQISNIFIPNSTLRENFKKEMAKTGYSQLNNIGLVAAKACYEYGDAWLNELKIYLEKNVQFLKAFLLEKLPKIKLVEPEGTYLIWLDFSELNLSDEKINELIIYEANLWLDNGTMFGKEGEHFQRINIACPTSFLEKGLNNLYETFKNY